MNLIFLSTASAGHYYTINHVHAVHPIKKVFLQRKAIGKDLWRRRLRRLVDWRKSRIVVRGALASVLFRRREAILRREYERQMYFDGREPLLSPLIPVEHVDTFNRPESVEIVRREEPDLIIVFGTELLRGEILSIAKVDIINVHRSIVPAYRGTGMPLWMFYHNDFDNLGTTVHRCVARADAGDIVGQERYKLQKDDRLYTLDYKTTVLAAQILVDVIQRFKDGTIEYRKQEGPGKLWLVRDLTIVRQLIARRNFKRYMRTL